ncbi:amidohydrolase/deacetylase family metallohydrolase [Flagellimonas algicola]|uniref:Amidohydrolase/deacetylase family metallohydrolase n=1 Tax=Flagellimonas algicola TaxID=2583815 RepID=A0ABY2WIW8_9FLAO|nr:amidohydrolase/deacetylase family metallohydrolase [Allomuricauda algicola]TMU54776.1 amidohydrolase/deacetylase family metallohydrolase [Allomuricauda algicola]
MKANPILSLLFCCVFAIPTLQTHAQDYDILIKNGHVIDAKNNIDQTMDVAISDGKIAKVAANIPKKSAKNVVDAKGLIVSPGFLDIHSHNFYGTVPMGYLSNSFSALPPDGFTFRSGVTTIADAGGAGWRNFTVFKEQVIDRSKTRVLAFLNIIGSGMKGGAVEQNLADMDPKLTAMLAKQYPEDIVGVKLAHYSGYNWLPTERTVEAGTLADIPVMIDFGGSDPELPLNTLFLEKLRAGDIFTHAYANVRGRTAIVDDNGKVRDYVIEARKKGIIFDVGHGGGSFLFDQAIPALEQGFKPNSISTDLHTGSMNAGMKDLSNIMSKFLAMGMPLNEVVHAVTHHPATIIKRPDLGNLSVGSVADVTVISIRKGEFGFVDVRGKKITGSDRVECELTLREGKVVWDMNGISKEEWKAN